MRQSVFGFGGKHTQHTLGFVYVKGYCGILVRSKFGACKECSTSDHIRIPLRLSLNYTNTAEDFCSLRMSFAAASSQTEALTIPRQKIHRK